MAPIIAKFCDIGKQHFATPRLDDAPVERKPVNDVLAEALNFFMGSYWTNVSLGRAAGVGEGTIRNYRTPDKRTSGKSGKPPSAKLTELELIAGALGVEIVDLLTDATAEDRTRILRRRAAEHYEQTGTLPPWAPVEPVTRAVQDHPSPLPGAGALGQESMDAEVRRRRSSRASGSIKGAQER